MGKGHAFVSYAREDRPRVQPLVEQFTAEGVAVFWDADLEPGSPWRDRLHEMLLSASCTWSCGRRPPRKRDFVRDEASRALEDDLDTAPQQLQQIEALVGYVRPQGET